MAVYSEICAVPTDRLAAEVHLLDELPSLRLQVGPKPVTRKVDKLSCIRFGSARYSVPNALIETTVTVLVDERDRTLSVVEPLNGQSMPSTTWSLPARSASTTLTTTGPDPRAHVGSAAADTGRAPVPGVGADRRTVPGRGGRRRGEQAEP